MKDRFVTIYRSYDPIQTQILVDILRDNNVEARKIGTDGAAGIGVGPSIIQVHIETPASQAKEAEEFIKLYLEGDGSLESKDDSEDDSSKGKVREKAEFRHRSPLVAAVAGIMWIFGGSHFYCQRPWTAGLIVVGQFMAISRMALATDEGGHLSGIGMFLMLVACDFVGGQYSARRHNRGHRASPVAQLIVGVVFLAAAIGADSLYANYVGNSPADSQGNVVD